jgi:hypothetical protein
MLPLHALLFGRRIEVVYQGLITRYYGPHKQIPIQLYEFQIFVRCFASTILHFLMKHSGYPSRTDFFHQQIFSQDRHNLTSANAHSVSYLMHIDSTILQDNIFHSVTVFFTDSIRWAS